MVLFQYVFLRKWEIGITLSISHCPEALPYALKGSIFRVLTRASRPLLRCPFPISHFSHISVPCAWYLVSGT